MTTVSPFRRQPSPSPQELFIQSARKLLKPTPVRLNKIPRWLQERLHEVRPRGSRGYQGYAIYGAGEILYDVVHTACKGSHPSLLDHWGTTVVNGQEWFVTEPYHLNLEAAKNFAGMLGLKWDYSANSWWYPGNTFRISFYLPRKEAEHDDA
jgi:hypothetical protein